MIEALLDPEISVPFPIEFMIEDTPLSHQGKNARAKESWKQKVAETARSHVATLREWTMLDNRPLAVTVFYFSPTPMEGDIDNIAKLILDGMIGVIYPNDRYLERVLVQKFEPGVEPVFRVLTPALEQASASKPPVVYVRADDDLGWRVVL